MAKRAKKTDATTVDEPKLQPAVRRRQSPRVTFKHGERVEVTVSGEDALRCVSRLLGCDIKSSVVSVALTRPTAANVVVTCHCVTAAQADALAGGVDG
jgi:hypothetical protein